MICRTHDKRNKAVYHTNVMLCVGTDVAIVCAEGVTDDSDRKRLLASLGAHQTVRRYMSLTDHCMCKSMCACMQTMLCSALLIL